MFINFKNYTYIFVYTTSSELFINQLLVYAVSEGIVYILFTYWNRVDVHTIMQSCEILIAA